MAYGEQITNIDQGWDAVPASRSVDVQELLRQADREATKAKVDILKFREAIPTEHPSHTEYAGLEAEVDAAWEELKAEVEHTNKIEMSDEERFAAEDKINAELKGLCEAPDAPFEAIESLLTLATRHPDLQKEAISSMTLSIGKKYAEQLFSPEFRQRLRQTADMCAIVIPEYNAPLLQERSIPNLIAIQETFGDRLQAIVEALRIEKYPSGKNKLIPQAPTEKSPRHIVNVSTVGFDQDGDIDSSIDISFFYLEANEQGELTGQDGQISRTFMRELLVDPKTKEKTPRVDVFHDVFEVPPDAMGNKLAAQITRNCLKEYDAMGADRITLIANITMGGYAWASYGYGWDQEKITEQKIQELIRASRTLVLNAYHEAGFTDTELQPILQRYAVAERDPMGVTPQFLARIGEDGPKLRKGYNGGWYKEEVFQQKLADGSEKEFEDMKGAFHAGKIGLMNQLWEGAIDLKPHGPQHGVNRKLLEKKLARTLQNV